VRSVGVVVDPPFFDQPAGNADQVRASGLGQPFCIGLPGATVTWAAPMFSACPYSPAARRVSEEHIRFGMATDEFDIGYRQKRGLP